MRFDPDDLSLGEMEDLEDVTGLRILTIISDFEKANPNAKELTALAWIMTRRENPDFTLEDARASKVNALFNPPSSNGQSAPKE